MFLVRASKCEQHNSEKRAVPLSTLTPSTGTWLPRPLHLTPRHFGAQTPRGNVNTQRLPETDGFTH
eukprot:2256094-Alexandrium_andersonii.AAC.1